MPPKRTVSVWDDVTVADVVSNLFVELTTFAMVFMAGAMVGSFVNVVLYRMPRRINLLWPPSRCPHCGTRLGLRDNVPVFSYLALQGKCRYCKAPIPRSYYRTEVRFGWLFLAVMYLTTHTGGIALPLRPADHYIGALWTIWYPKPELQRIWLYHTALVSFLAVLYLFVRRGAAIPGLVPLAALAVGITGAAYLGGVQQVPLTGERERIWYTAGATEAVVGAAVGLLLGVLSVLASRTPRTSMPEIRSRFPIPLRWAWPAVLAVAGCWLGWQAAISVGVFTGLFGLLFRRPPPVHLAFVAVATQLALWRLLSDFAPWWPGPHTPLALMPVWAAAGVGLLAARGRLSPVSGPTEPTAEASPRTEAPTPEPAVPIADSAADNGTSA